MKNLQCRAANAHGFRYVFLGEELGARPEDPSCYEDNRVSYSRISETDLFQQGIERVWRGIGEFRVALMCAEKEPVECHRTLLVAPEFIERGAEVWHILEDGSLEAHGLAMDRLRALMGVEEGDFFLSQEELIAEAAKKQEARITHIAEASEEEDSTGT